MGKFKSIALFVILLFLAAVVQAQTPYQGIDYADLHYSDSEGYRANLKALRYKMGVQVNPKIAFEGHIIQEIASDTINVSGVGVKLELDSGFGLYMLIIFPLKGNAESEEKGKFYFIAGYTYGSGTVSASGISITDSNSDMSYGVGGEILFTKHFAGTVEYAQLIKKPIVEYSSLSMGIKFYF